MNMDELDKLDRKLWEESYRRERLQEIIDANKIHRRTVSKEEKRILEELTTFKLPLHNLDKYGDITSKFHIAFINNEKNIPAALVEEYLSLFEPLKYIKEIEIENILNDSNYQDTLKYFINLSDTDRAWKYKKKHIKHVGDDGNLPLTLEGLLVLVWMENGDIIFRRDKKPSSNRMRNIVNLIYDSFYRHTINVTRKDTSGKTVALYLSSNLKLFAGYIVHNFIFPIPKKKPINDDLISFVHKRLHPSRKS